ncbi:MAG TPA: DUF721 domain-containing protein [Candidatus Gastranaerophilales bacterium]|nr:DUF721 domain-containing protein [Candidatus Gastranaerophilales bacterium]
MKKPSYFENINSVIETLMEELGLEKGLKINSIAKLWSKIVGPRFEKTSKIYSIYASKGYEIAIVAVSSSTVAQELSFYKAEIVKKLYNLGKNYGFNIKEVNFSTKHWKEDV